MSKEETGWGQSVAGLRCRWLSVTEPLQVGTAPRVMIEVENVSKKLIFWECRKQITCLIAHSGSNSQYGAPMFEVKLGPGAAVATAGDVRRHLDIRRRGMKGDEPHPGFHRLDLGARMALSTTLPWTLARPGATLLNGHVSRFYQLGWNLEARQISMTCPALVLRVNGQ